MNLPVWEGDRVFTPLIYNPGIGFFSVKLVYEGKNLVGKTIFTY